MISLGVGSSCFAPLPAGTSSGYLEALSSDGGKEWQMKFFRIQDNYMLYFKDRDSPNHEGVISLEGSAVRRSTLDDKYIELTSGFRVYHLRGTDDNEASAWINAIERASKLAFDEFFDIKEVLGRGTFSEVRRAVHKPTGKQFAIKVIDKSTITNNYEGVVTEIAVLREVDHKHIIHLEQIFEYQHGIHLVCELLSGGELFDRIVKRKFFSEKNARDIIAQVATAIQYLHSMGIIHRDLKPENLLFRDDSEDSEIKISDFGLAKFFAPGEIRKPMFQVCGTMGYVAPEILEQVGYDEKVDIWSLGIILYVLLCGYLPFYSQQDSEMADLIMKGELVFHSPSWDSISISAKDLVRGMLQRNPKKRLTTKQIINHPWVASGDETLSSQNNPSVIEQIGSLVALSNWKHSPIFKQQFQQFQLQQYPQDELIEQQQEMAPPTPMYDFPNLGPLQHSPPIELIASLSPVNNNNRSDEISFSFTSLSSPNNIHTPYYLSPFNRPFGSATHQLRANFSDMKGTPHFPQGMFSSDIEDILQQHQTPFVTTTPDMTLNAADSDMCSSRLTSVTSPLGESVQQDHIFD